MKASVEPLDCRIRRAQLCGSFVHVKPSMSAGTQPGRSSGTHSDEHLTGLSLIGVTPTDADTFMPREDGLRKGGAWGVR